MPEKSGRAKFGAKELAICLSHYDLGVIYKMTEFPRGSRRAPKVVIECDKGKFLFKRRTGGKKRIKKVAFTHQIQLALAGQNFPLPHLLGTKEDNNSMLILGEDIYEMQEYISGSEYDGSKQATRQSGHALGLYHKLLEEFESDFEPLTASYHNAKAIHQAIFMAKDTLKKRDTTTSETQKKIEDTVDYLGETYKSCSHRCNELGLKDWPDQIVHGDWHPGNMLFKEHLITAVIDYDTARLQQRAIDLANGSLQFSIVGGGTDPTTWPGNLDIDRFEIFLKGYDSVNIITTDELRVIPYLMCEAMIAEAALPIASTGEFGKFDGIAFFFMIKNKVSWILDNVDRLCAVLD